VIAKKRIIAIVTTATVTNARKLERNVDETMFAVKDSNASLAVVERLLNEATTYQDVRKINIARRDYVVPRAMASLCASLCCGKIKFVLFWKEEWPTL
jgi:cobalamin-dependent methionine synthase I